MGVILIRKPWQFNVDICVCLRIRIWPWKPQDQEEPEINDLSVYGLCLANSDRNPGVWPRSPRSQSPKSTI